MACRAMAASLTADRIWTVLKTCFDPKIAVSTVVLGLVQAVALEALENANVDVQMTLTAFGSDLDPRIVRVTQKRSLPSRRLFGAGGLGMGSNPASIHNHG